MTKIAIVGDVHISPTCGSRKDNYLETCLKKLEHIFQNNDIVIFGGDLFDRPSLPLETFYEVFTLFKKYHKVQKYDIIGNHCCYNMNESTIYKTTLGLAEIVEILKVLRPTEKVSVDGFTFEATSVNFKNLTPSDSKAFFLFHHYYGLSCAESLSDDMLDRLYPNRIGCFCFHDHQYYEPINNVYRTGSLMRNAMTEYNRIRKPIYYQIDTNNNSIEPISIPCEPAENVFVENVFNKTKQRQEQFIQRLDETINLCSKKIDINKDYSMIETLKELKTPRHCMEYIVKACKTLQVELR